MFNALRRLLNNQFTPRPPQPTTFNEGLSTFKECQWTEQEMVVWINQQPNDVQRLCWATVAQAKKDGANELRVLCLAREQIERNRAQAAADAPRWYETWFDMRMGWYLGGLFSGRNKLP